MSLTFAMIRKIDPAAAWDALPEQARRAFGIAGLTYLVSERAGDDVDTFILAISECSRRGMEEMEAVVDEFVDADPEQVVAIDPATVGVAACRECGCCEERGHEGDYMWADKTRTLCRSCAKETPAC